MKYDVRIGESSNAIVVLPTEPMVFELIALKSASKSAVLPTQAPHERTFIHSFIHTFSNIQDGGLALGPLRHPKSAMASLLAPFF